MEMAKTKLVAIVLLCAVSFGVQAREYTWKRYLMDGSRTGGKTINELSGTPKKAAKLLDSCQEGMAELKTVVGYCPEALPMYRPQSPLTNLVADILLEEGSRIAGEPCDMSITNNGGIRVELPKGDVFLDDIRSMLPFKNNVAILKMRGDKILGVLEFMASKRFEAIGGVKVVVGKDGIESVMIGGKPLEKDRLYTVSANSFLLDGGDGYYLRRDSEQCNVTDEYIYDIAMNYINRLKADAKPIVSKVDDRVVLNYEPDNSAVPTTEPLPPFSQKRLSTDRKRVLTILHTNDTHSHLEPIRGGRFSGLGGIVERAALIDSVRKADGRRNVLLLDAGDFDQGTSYFTTFGGEIELKAMNLLGYDAGTLGNHEWDNGLDDLNSRLTRLNQKMLLCNYRIDNKAFWKQVKPYAIVRRGGHKIGLVGILANLDGLTRGIDTKLDYIYPVEPVNELATFLKEKKKCDVVIVISHCGTVPERKEDGDIRMAPKLKNVDIIVGGHSHTDLKEPVYVDGADGKPVMILSDYQWGIYVGEIKL